MDGVTSRAEYIDKAVSGREGLLDRNTVNSIREVCGQDRDLPVVDTNLEHARSHAVLYKELDATIQTKKFVKVVVITLLDLACLTFIASAILIPVSIACASALSISAGSVLALDIICLLVAKKMLNLDSVTFVIKGIEKSVKDEKESIKENITSFLSHSVSAKRPRLRVAMAVYKGTDEERFNKMNRKEYKDHLAETLPAEEEVLKREHIPDDHKVTYERGGIEYKDVTVIRRLTDKRVFEYCLYFFPLIKWSLFHGVYTPAQIDAARKKEKEMMLNKGSSGRSIYEILEGI